VTEGGTGLLTETKQALVKWQAHKNFTTLCCSTFSSNLAVTVANRLGKATLVPLVGEWLTLILYAVAVGACVERERRVIARSRLWNAGNKIMKSNMLSKMKQAGGLKPASIADATSASSTESQSESAQTGCKYHDALTDMVNLRRELAEGWHDYAYASLFMIPAFGFVNAVAGSSLFPDAGSFSAACCMLATMMGAVAALELVLYMYLDRRHSSLKKKDRAPGAWDSK
jgi:hypothetical protein